ncbi:MAG TPA: hypothetical protein VH394_25340 [Thermoanaerobaculia bacterium]|jgi:hypothetical protein|nr:hypothetical protein [Thermoanaerobaculia bacterium]
MKRRLHSRLWLLPVLALVLMAFARGRVRITEHDVEQEAVVVDATLGLFLNLANLQTLDPSATRRLLDLNPRDLAEALRSMEPGFAVYEQQLATLAQVRPVILFLDKQTDPGEAARRYELSLASWPANAPPALLSGPSADVLILFEPIAKAGLSPEGRGPVAVTRIASTLGMEGFRLAQSSPEPLDRRLYLVQPRDWKASAAFEHTRCLEPRPELELVTKLIYHGGSIDSLKTTIKDKSWSECKLVSQQGLRSVTVKQPGRRTAGRPGIIAASYFRSPQPGPLLADYVRVN